MVGIGSMRCDEIDVPPLDDRDVMVRSEFASICGSDLHMVMMGAGLVHPVPCPHGFPGHEGVGQVVESRTDALAEGTWVLTFPNPPRGECFNDYQRLDASYCLPLPTTDGASGIERSHLLMAQQLGTVIYAMRQHPRDVVGETVVVIGQGSAGLFFTHLLKGAGAARVVVADLSEARLDVARRWGADVAVNASDQSLTEVVNDLTGGAGADYVIEAVGSSETFLSSVDLVRTDGELLWFGLPATNDNIPVRFQHFFRKRLRAASVYGAQDEPNSTSFARALDIIASGELDVSPLLSHVISVERIDEAMELAHNPVDAGALKVSVDLR